MWQNRNELHVIQNSPNQDLQEELIVCTILKENSSTSNLLWSPLFALTEDDDRVDFEAHFSKFHCSDAVYPGDWRFWTLNTLSMPLAPGLRVWLGFNYISGIQKTSAGINNNPCAETKPLVFPQHSPKSTITTSSLNLFSLQSNVIKPLCYFPACSVFVSTVL